MNTITAIQSLLAAAMVLLGLGTLYALLTPGVTAGGLILVWVIVFMITIAFNKLVGDS